MPSATVALRPRILRRAHLRLLVEAVSLAQDALAEPSVLAAARRYFRRPFAHRDALDRWLFERDAHSQFLPWLLWDAELPAGALGVRLDADERSPAELEVLQALLVAQPDVFEVVGHDGDDTVLERVADGHRVHVTEPALRAVASRGELYVARIAECGDVSLLDAVHACVPSAARLGLVRAARRVRGVSGEHVQPLLLRATARAMGRLAESAPAWSDNDALLRATLVYDGADPAAVAAALRAAVTAGQLEARGADRFAIVDDAFGPVGAQLRLQGTRLYATTSSPARVERLQAGLDVLLPGLAPTCTLYRDLGELLDPARRDDAEPGELQRLAQDWLGECLVGFHDTPHAWLGGATPREAVRTAAGRLQVHAWLRTVEQVSEVAGPAYRSALQRIWRELAAT